jgi:hypothetical protein
MSQLPSCTRTLSSPDAAGGGDAPPLHDSDMPTFADPSFSLSLQAPSTAHLAVMGPSIPSHATNPAAAVMAVTAQSGQPTADPSSYIKAAPAPSAAPSLAAQQPEANNSPTLPIPRPDHPCDICLLPTREQDMLLCDHCNHGIHFDCLGLDSVPSGAWFCPSCAPLQLLPPSHNPSPPTLPSTLPSSQPTRTWPAPNPSDHRFWDPLLAAELHGKQLQRSFTSHPNKTFVGHILFSGKRHRPYAFKTTHPEDGDVR